MLVLVVVCVGEEGWLLSLVLFDFDYFKVYNDVYGYYVGDNLLCEVYCVWLVYLLSDVVLVCYGGEEFVLLLFGVLVVEVVGLVENL